MDFKNVIVGLPLLTSVTVLTPFYCGSGISTNNEHLRNAAPILAKWLVKGGGKAIVWTRQSYELFKYASDTTELVQVSEQYGNKADEANLRTLLEVNQNSGGSLKIARVSYFEMTVIDEGKKLGEVFLVISYEVNSNQSGTCEILLKASEIRECFKQSCGFGGKATFSPKDFYVDIKKAKDTIESQLRTSYNNQMDPTAANGDHAHGVMGKADIAKGFCILHTLLLLNHDDVVMDPTAATGYTVRVAYLVERHLRMLREKGETEKEEREQ